MRVEQGAGTTRAEGGMGNLQATVTSHEQLMPEVRASIRMPYGLRRVPEAALASLVPFTEAPRVGDIALARLEEIGKNTTLELASGRRCALREGDLLAVVFGNRYATRQFEGYARTNGDRCDLLSMGGLCGLVESKYETTPEPSKLRLLGALADSTGRNLRLQEFALRPVPASSRPKVIVVCGSSMDAGKTYAAASVISALRHEGHRVAGIKLTGTAAGRDTWNLLDAGASVALDFIDGGLPSTYLCGLDELLDLHALLTNHATSLGADWAVVEIADGLLQRETAALLQSRRFRATVDFWLLAAGEALAAVGSVSVLKAWGIKPIAISGRLSLSSLELQEAQAATGVKCLTARDLRSGGLRARLITRPTRRPGPAHESHYATA